MKLHHETGSVRLWVRLTRQTSILNWDCTFTHGKQFYVEYIGTNAQYKLLKRER